MKILLPDNVNYIIHKLEEAGYEAYAVGGCVRDSILGRSPGDWDITTSAKPEEIKKIFKKTIDTGIEHGTVTVMQRGEGYEVTTYRIDGEYEDSRHPKEVTFTASLVEDLKRRDFTINAMAYNDTIGLVDIFSGMEDIKKGIIRCVGDPKERFTEDALRMMRAVRFAAQLGYAIEENTSLAIKMLSPTLANISAERIQTELVKLLLSDHPDWFRKAYELGMTAQFMPEFDKLMECKQNNPHHIYDVGEHTLHSLCHVSSHKVLRLSMLLHDIGKPHSHTTDENGISHFYGHNRLGKEMAAKILKRLKFDNDTIKKVSLLVGCHDDKLSENPGKLRKYIAKISPEMFLLLLQVKRADMMAQSMYKREEKETMLHTLQSLYDKIQKEGDCLSLKELAVCGKDLIETGMKPSKEIGEKLAFLLDHVLEYPKDNEKEILLKILREK